MVNYANYTTECADINIEASVNKMDADEPTGPMVQIALIGILGIGMVLFLRRERKD